MKRKGAVFLIKKPLNMFPEQELGMVESLFLFTVYDVVWREEGTNVLFGNLNFDLIMKHPVVYFSKIFVEL